VKTILHYDLRPSPVGHLRIISDGESLTGIDMLNMGDDPDPAPERGVEWVRSPATLRVAGDQLAAYFAGELTAFELPLAPSGTPFQLGVWETLCSIPYGQTISYRELALRIGNPKAVRAVGAANGRNPIPIVVPCHRVIGADGSLTGYGGGLPRKQVLLELEGAGRWNTLSLR
jgi:methylated-DNA-[protein]-cysteine S-methyltransferase